MPTEEMITQQPQQGRGAQQLQKSTFPSMLEKFKGEIARALPRHLNPDRMCRIALTEFRKNPKLAECDPRSVFAAIIVASQLGLEPGVLGQAYLIPYKTECQLIVGYQGLVDLVRRSGLVQRVEAHVVHERDKFTYKTGLNTVLEHEPVLEGDPGKNRLVYAVAEFKDGGYHVEVMTQDQVERIRDRSQAVINAKKYNKTTPWDTDTEEMWRKTVLRRICKFLPKSPEIATAISLDDASAQGRQNITVQDAIDGTWQAPVLEVTTQDNRLAEKSAANLEALKERHQEPEPVATAAEPGASQQSPSPPVEEPASAGSGTDDGAPVEAGAEAQPQVIEADPPPELEAADFFHKEEPPSQPTISPRLEFSDAPTSRKRRS